MTGRPDDPSTTREQRTALLPTPLGTDLLFGGNNERQEVLLLVGSRDRRLA